ncbi:MAG: AraC family transcriptional regulator [Chitinophagaceae bacterium]|nr:MAG: AraC family transcriptional regulator [Chitinophagaceae bacterium]
MQSELFHEITPLKQSDCFWVAKRLKSCFDFPLHYHEEYELNFISNAKGAQRVIGDHIGEIDDLELVLVGSNLPHAWFTNNMNSKRVNEITIQFHKNLFSDKFLKRDQLSFIRIMLEKSNQGILFSTESTMHIMHRLRDLNQKLGFDSVLELISILNFLSRSVKMTLLSDSTFNNVNKFNYNSRRIEKALAFMDQNFDKTITLSDVAKLNNMTDSAFSRFFKTHTGKTFLDILIEKRLGHVSRLLIESPLSIADIAEQCGFNNISNFNRLFKKKKGFTPNEFREEYSNISRIFI